MLLFETYKFVGLNNIFDVHIVWINKQQQQQQQHKELKERRNNITKYVKKMSK